MDAAAADVGSPRSVPAGEAPHGRGMADDRATTDERPCSPVPGARGRDGCPMVRQYEIKFMAFVPANYVSVRDPQASCMYAGSPVPVIYAGDDRGFDDAAYARGRYRVGQYALVIETVDHRGDRRFASPVAKPRSGRRWRSRVALALAPLSATAVEAGSISTITIVYRATAGYGSSPPPTIRWRMSTRSSKIRPTGRSPWHSGANGATVCCQICFQQSVGISGSPWTCLAFVHSSVSRASEAPFLPMRHTSTNCLLRPPCR